MKETVQHVKQILIIRLLEEDGCYVDIILAVFVYFTLQGQNLMAFKFVDVEEGGFNLFDIYQESNDITLDLADKLLLIMPYNYTGDKAIELLEFRDKDELKKAKDYFIENIQEEYIQNITGSGIAEGNVLN